MDLKPITDADDPRVAPYRDIQERDLRRREGLFIAEGEVVLRVLATRSRHRCLSVLIDGRRLDKLTPILSDLPEEMPVYVAERAVIDAIAGFPLHRGILALGEEAKPPAMDALLAAAPERAVVLALHGIANHDNMGGIFRNAAAFGAHAVLLDATCCDPLYRKAIRVSVGAALSVPFARWAGDALLPALESNGFAALALSPSGAVALAAFHPPPPGGSAARRGRAWLARCAYGAGPNSRHTDGRRLGLPERRHHVRDCAASPDGGPILIASKGAAALSAPAGLFIEPRASLAGGELLGHRV